MRRFPSLLRVGDSVKARFALPPLDDGEAWASAQLTMRLKSDTENVEQPFAATIDSDGCAQVIITAAQTAGLRDGMWLYSVVGTGAGVSVMTLEAGMVDVQNALNPSSTFNERMVQVLRATIESKITGRGDVLHYIIGDREVRTLSLDELTTQLNHYETRLARERQPRRNWTAVGYG